MGLASLSKKMLEQRSLMGAARMLALFTLPPSALLIHRGGWVGAFGLFSTIGCLAILARALIHLSAVERDIRALCDEDKSAARSVPAAISLLRSRLASVGHRYDPRHPVTGLPTREHLFAGINEDLADECAHMLLGVLCFAEYDRLAGLDQDRASEILHELSKRLTAAVGPRHMLAQIDRHSFAIWLRTVHDGAAAAEMRALLYVVGQDIVTASGRFSRRPPGSRDRTVRQGHVAD
jgi:GGDEF domain-containing protein